MKQNYSSRQRKIYNDYNVHSTETLLEILRNKGKYIAPVIEIVKDILSERNALFISENIENKEDLALQLKEEAALIEERQREEKTIKSFTDSLKEKSADELQEIITRYTSYNSEMVKAALIISVDKGIISYELKENILRQIETNLATHNKKILNQVWEKNNAFKEYVSGYDDEKIYAVLDDPGGMVIDVYHAILLVALERELISGNDFREYFKSAKSAIRSDDEISEDEFKEFIGYPDPVNEPVDEAELEEEAEKYWICPSCNELVGMEFGVCWNCQTVMPETVKHPDKEEILKERAGNKVFTPVKTGLGIIAAGIFVTLLSYWRYHSSHFIPFYFSPSFWIGIIAVIAGISFTVYGLFFYSGTEYRNEK